MEILLILGGVVFLFYIPHMVMASRRKAIAAALPVGRQLVGLDGLAGLCCVDAAQSIVVRRHGDAQNVILTWDKISSCDIIEESGGQQTETVATAKRPGVFGRAVVGKLLGGNAGEVVGGLTGRTNTRSRSHTEDQVLRILCQIRFADVGLPEVSIRLYTDPYGRKLSKSSRQYQNAMDTARSWHALMEAVIAQSARSGPPHVQATARPIDHSMFSVADEMRNLAAPKPTKAALTPKQLVGGMVGVFLLALVLSIWSKVFAVILMALVVLGVVYQAKTHLTKIAGGVTGGLLLLALVALVWPGKVEKPLAEAPPPRPSTAATAPASSASAPAQPVQPAPEPAQVLARNGFKPLYKAAKAGDVAAQLELASLYNTDNGAWQDYAEAARWYRKAAEQGSVNGQAMLGAAYFLGRGVTQDYAEAYFWASLAGARANDPGKVEQALQLRDRAASFLLPSALEKLQKRCRQWTATLAARQAIEQAKQANQAAAKSVVSQPSPTQIDQAADGSKQASTTKKAAKRTRATEEAGSDAAASVNSSEERRQKREAEKAEQTQRNEFASTLEVFMQRRGARRVRARGTTLTIEADMCKFAENQRALLENVNEKTRAMLRALGFTKIRCSDPISGGSGWNSL
jgi:hypothetical protein